MECLVFLLRMTSGAWGVKLLSGLVLRQRTLLYLLPDGSRVNRQWLGWVLPFSISESVHLTSQMSAGCQM